MAREGQNTQVRMELGEEPVELPVTDVGIVTVMSGCIRKTDLST
jgi:hypothetical protein